MPTRPDPRQLGAARQARPGPASPEYQFFELLTRLDKFREGRVIVQFHLSRLQAHHRREHYLRVARTTVEDALGGVDAQLFMFGNDDIIVQAKHAPMPRLEQIDAKLRQLFADDPLVRVPGPTGFATWYRLEHDYSELMTVAYRLYEESMPPRDPAAAATRREVRTPISLAQIAQLQDVIAKADLSVVMRNQAVCALTLTGPPQPIFDEIYVSIADLERRTLPGVDLLADRSLFQYLTRSLDRRVLTLLARDLGRNPERTFSLNLNVSMLISDDFARFDQSLHARLRGRIIIEVQLLEVLADVAQFVVVRDFLRERGYRICVDGCTQFTLPMLARDRVGADFVKVFWSPELTTARPDVLEDIKAAVDRIGGVRVILARCGGPEAVEIGRSLGISLFQGHYITQLQRAAAGSRAAPARAPTT